MKNNKTKTNQPAQKAEPKKMRFNIHGESFLADMFYYAGVYQTGLNVCRTIISAVNMGCVDNDGKKYTPKRVAINAGATVGIAVATLVGTKLIEDW